LLLFVRVCCHQVVNDLFQTLSNRRNRKLKNFGAAVAAFSLPFTSQSNLFVFSWDTFSDCCICCGCRVSCHDDGGGDGDYGNVCGDVCDVHDGCVRDDGCCTCLYGGVHLLLHSEAALELLQTWQLLLIVRQLQLS